MTYEANTGLGVTNHYGPRTSGKTVGVVGTMGREVELSIDIDEDTVTNGGPLLVNYTIPAGAIITAAYLVITEVFALGGTTPAIEIGTDTTEATNGFTITKAQAEAIATTNLTTALSGTWDAEAPLAAATVIGVVLSGTTPTITADTGKGKVIIKYTLTA